MRRTSRRSAALGLAVIGLLGIPTPASALAPTAGTAASAPSDRLSAIVYRAGPKWRPGVPMEQQGLRDHFFYMRDLHARGVIRLAGPRGTDGGVIILHARDQAEADRILAADPAVAAGLFTGEALSFTPRFGAIAPPESASGSKPATPVNR
jgi:uncharacterized protein